MKKMKNKLFRLADLTSLIILFTLFLTVTITACKIDDDIDDTQTQNYTKNPTYTLPTPSAPTVETSDRALVVKITPIYEAESYDIYISTSTQPPSSPVKTAVTTTVVLVDNLKNGTTYYVWIKAKTDTKSSDFSSPGKGVPWDPNTIPVTPGRPTITPGIKQLTINWDICGGATSYEVYINTSQTQPYYCTQSISNETSAVITNLQDYVTYYIWIKAVNSKGKSDFSPVAVGTPQIPTVAPVAPSKPSVIAGSHKLIVYWEAVELTESYEVWYGTSDNSALAQKYGSDISGGITTATITSLENDTTYYVWIKAKNIKGTSDFSPVASDKTSAFASVPQAPNTPTVIAGNSELNVSWQAVEGALSYEVWIAQSYIWNGQYQQYYPQDGEKYDVSDTTITLSELNNETKYYIWVKAKNNMGISEFSARASGTPSVYAAIPSVPQAPTVVAGSNQLTINWQAADGAKNYEIWAGTSNDSANATKRSDVSGLSYVITGLTNGTTYYIWIKAKNNIGTSDFSPMANGIPLASYAVPVTPSTPSVILSNGQITVTWSAVEGASAYEIWKGTSTNSASATKYGDDITESLSVTVDSLSNGTTYYFWVKAKNSIGTSGFSPYVSGKHITDASTPTLVSANGQITVSWSSLTGADQYEVFCGTSTTPPQTATKTVTSTSTTISSLTNGTTYSIWVRGKNTTGTGVMSNAASAKPIGNMEAVTVSPVGNGELVLNWTAVAGADQYDVYYSTSASIPASPSQTVLTNTATISGLTNGTLYYVWVKGKNANGTSNTSSVVSSKPMGTLGNLTVSVGNQQIMVSWAAVTGATSYKIYYSITPTIPDEASFTVSELSKTITSLNNGTIYYFWLKAVNDKGTSNASPMANGKPIDNMGTVTVSPIGSSQLVLNWTAVAGADEYDVYYSTTNSIPASPSQTVSTNTATINGLTNGTLYYIWVKPKNATGVGNTSSVVSGKPMATPSDLSISVGNQQITVSWSTVTGATSYEVYHNTTATIPTVASFTVTEPSKTITGLNNGTTYYFWIKAINANGTSGASPMASGKPIGNMGTVTLTTGGSGQLILSWSVVAGADEYEVYFNTSNSIPASPSQTVLTNTATISGLTNGTLYYVWVKGKNANGTGTISTSVNSRPIGMPSDLTISVGNQQITVNWAAVTGATSYKVYYSITPTIPNEVFFTVTELSKTITSLNNGTIYYFWIKAVNDKGTSGSSPMTSGKPIDNMGMVTVSPSGSGQLVLSWSAVAGADEYDVYYSTINSIPVSPLQTVSTNTATINNLTNGTLYYIWVKPKNATGVGNTSSVVSGKPIGMLGIPTVNSDYKQLLVTWTTVAGADEYEVYYGTSTTPTTLATTTTGTSTTITGLVSGTTYYVRLRAKNTTGVTNYGPSASGIPNKSRSPGLYRGMEKIGTQNLVDSLTYISSNAISGDEFYIVLGADESTTPRGLNYYNRIVTITLLGYGCERIITLNIDGDKYGCGSLFDIGSGITLVLDDNITLLGASNNYDALVSVRSNGKLVMNNGSKISGNRIKGSGGGVHVYDNGTFTMSGGIISGNSTYDIAGYYGGGVYSLGTFIMSGGTISGNNSTAGGSGVYVGGGTFTMSSGIISSNNSFCSTNNSSGEGSGVKVGSGTFIMSGGEISSNTTTTGGGGVSVDSRSGTFNKTGGTITGYASDSINGNVVKNSSGIVQENKGHAVLVTNFNYYLNRRETTAGQIDDIDTTTGKGLSENGYPPFGE